LVCGPFASSWQLSLAHREGVCLSARGGLFGNDQMNFEPPNGSRISVTTDGAHPVILVPHGSGGVMRYFVGTFMLAWLGGWFVGLIATVWKLLSGGAPREAQAFLVFWLVGWILAGAMAMYWAYRLFRPSVPESLTLMPKGVTYDSGIPPPPSRQTYWGSTSVKDQWKSMFPKRTRVEVDRQKLQSLRLRETNDGNRLTIDADARRLDIAYAASEIEREWLYQLLTKRYALPLPRGS
jgi:hypothetical protein